LARRTPDLLANESARDERRRTSRSETAFAARLRLGDLLLEGTITDASRGGIFLATHLLVEIGERGTLEVGDLEVAVQVVWLRGNSHVTGPGMGLTFEDGDAAIGRLLARLEV
jgi:hypothetical protein